MSDFKIQAIPSIAIERFWPFAEPYVKRGLDHGSGEVMPCDLKASCKARDVQLWLVTDGQRVVGAATTEIICYPRKKHCRVITIAGSGFADWMGLMDRTLCEWATKLGCDAIEALVRRGFVPKLATISYKHKHSVVVKNLSIIEAVSSKHQAEEQDG